MTLDDFKAKVEEYSTNTETALMGYIQITSNEREDLRQRFAELAPGEREEALAFLKSHKVDATGW